MKKKLLSIMLMICIISSMCISISAADYTKEQYNQMILDAKAIQTAVHNTADQYRALGFADSHPIIKACQDEWWAQKNNIDSYKSAIESIEVEETTRYTCTQAQWDQYYYACLAWEYMRNEMGLSREVSAGVLGRWMHECGGTTLNLNPFIYSGGYYGYAMWYLRYTNGQLYWGSSAEDQLAYFGKTLGTNYKYFGGDYSTFLSMSDPGNACYYFTYYYERGAWSSVDYTYAWQAYNYFSEPSN